jgi:hypothetical protein
VSGSIRQAAAFFVGLSALLFLTPMRSARAQVAFVPEVGFIPTGVTMTVTPVVTPDRRYVRLSVSAFFNTFNNFLTLSVPAAVGGQFGGGFGGAGGGAIGVQPVFGAGFGAFGLMGEPLAGPPLPALGPVRGDPFAVAGANHEAAAGLGALAQGGEQVAAEANDAAPALDASGAAPRARAARHRLPGQHRAGASRPTRRPSAGARRNSR